MLRAKNVNMLQGPLFKNIVLYTIPIIITNTLQLLFNAADIIVVGRYCGSLSVAAVGSTGSIVNLLVNIMIGLSIGTGICAAQSIGARDERATSQTVHTAIPIALIIGGVVSILGFLFSGTILHMMNTPDDILPLASVYLKIYFLGAISNSVYNFGSSILRAAGDTKSPLIFLSLSGVLNVVMNIIFVKWFNMNVAGVALATSISQTVSAGLVIITLAKRNDACRLTLKNIRIHKKVLSKVMRIGVPAGLQSSMFSVSNVIIQSSVNTFGSVVVSGGAAAANIEGFLYTAMNALYQTSLNFTGQNFGAKNFKRIKKILLQCISSVLVLGFTLGIALYVFARPLLSIYITDSPLAIEAGVTRMSYICIFYFLCGIMEVLSGTVRGMGYSFSPMVISVVFACIFRIVWIFTVFTAPQYHTLGGIYSTYPISWFLTIVAYLVLYFIIMKKTKRQLNSAGGGYGK